MLLTMACSTSPDTDNTRLGFSMGFARVRVKTSTHVISEGWY